MSFFRYPGGKSKLKSQISSQINLLLDSSLEYREPFFGGGSIGLQVIEDNPVIERIWINDFDLGISCLWTAVVKYPDKLKELVKNFKPSIQNFDDFKKELTSNKISQDEVEIGFKKLAIHQISYSGLGTKSGGPLGGRTEGNVSGDSATVKYPIDCRWSPDYICRKIDKLHNKIKKISIRNEKCTSLDFEQIINDTLVDAVIYLDPPYFVKGNDLYQHGFALQDHYRLASALKATKHRWILSYDDCPEIRELYQWARIKEINVNYSITALKDKNTGERLSRLKTELLISL